MDPRSLGVSLTRWKTKSTSLLALSLIPLGGLIFAAVWGMMKDFRAGDKFFHWAPIFQISDNNSLTTYLTIIGIFHSFIGYCIHQLATRAATQVRTRAFLSGTSSVELLNDLPGSPYWQRYFKSHLAWKSLLGFGILFPMFSTVGGILYKQALVLSTFQSQTETSYDYTFMTNCTNDIGNCPGNRYLKYGVALSNARLGSAYTTGVEITESGRRLTFVAAPTTAPLTSLQRNITSLKATSLAMVADYRNVTSDETLPKTRDIDLATYNKIAVSISFHGANDLEWSFSALQRQSDDKPYQTVRGMTRYCVVQCEWRMVNSVLLLHKYTLDDANCAQLNLGYWTEGFGTEIAYALASDIIDENWNIKATHHDVLRSAYVVAAMYAVIVLGGWAELWGGLRNNNLTSGIFLSPVLNVTQNTKNLAIETKPAFMIPYLAVLAIVFIAQWTLGFFSQTAYLTEWAPLWFGILSDSEQENVRKQIRGSDIFESKGLEEIKSKESSWIINPEEIALLNKYEAGYREQLNSHALWTDMYINSNSRI